MATATHDVRLMRELEPVVERELDRHLGVAKDWFPHEYVPWGEGSDFDGPYAGQAWDPEQSRMDEVSRNSLELNLLTEDNLPSYHREIADVFGHDGAWGTWVGRWTAEEGRHAIAIRDYLVVTRSVDPVELERARMQHMTTGYTSTVDGGMLQSVAYVSFQELATRISHRNTGRHTGDPGCERLLARIAADENLHMLFYRNLLDAAFDVAPARRCARSPTSCATSRCPEQPSPTTPAARCRSRWPASTTCASITTRCSHPCSGPGTSGTDPASGPTATRPGRNSRCSCPASTQLPRDSNRNAPPASSGWPQQPDHAIVPRPQLHESSDDPAAQQQRAEAGPGRMSAAPARKAQSRTTDAPKSLSPWRSVGRFRGAFRRWMQRNPRWDMDVSIIVGLRGGSEGRPVPR